MRRRAIISLIVLLAFFPGIKGQITGISFSGHFEETPFAEFASAIEAQTGIKFYYRALWVQDIQVSVSGKDLSLFKVMDSILGPLGLNYYLDEWNHLFLTESAELIDALPEYEGFKIKAQAEEEDQIVRGSVKITSAEQNYIDGRRVRVLEEIHVGSADRVVPGRKVLISGHIHQSSFPICKVKVGFEQ